MRKSLYFVLLLLFGFAAAAGEIKPVKYVFLFIGDGMSIPQRMSADEYLSRTENRTLKMNKFPAQAITTTSSASAFITDSAAAGTAIACGEKTKNGRIGMCFSLAKAISESIALFGVVRSLKVTGTAKMLILPKSVSRYFSS